MDKEYRTALRDLMAKKGHPVEFDERWKSDYPDSPDLWVSVYGWVDHRADEHGRVCGWEVPAGVALTEVSYSEFTDTDADNKTTLGINVTPTESVDIRCRCGEFRGVTLRWEGSITEALQTIFGMPEASGSITL
jgi:hypothetical protein